MVTEMGEKIGILFFLFINSGFCLEISTDNKELVENVGNSVVLECDIIGEGLDPWSHTVTWFKIDHDGVSHQINTVSSINEPYQETGRFTILKPKPTEPIVLIWSLQIEDITLNDNGTYQCSLKNNNDLLDSITHTIFIPASVEHLDFTSTKMRATEKGNAFEFVELESTSVECTVTGGNPRPKLHIYRDATDITSEFELINDQKLAGDKGLHYTEYATSLSNKDFKATREMREQTLTCEAKFPGHADMDQKKTATIEVKFEPTFSCDSHQQVPFGSTNYTIQCKIEANPPVMQDSITWTLIDTNITVSESETADVYEPSHSFDGETGEMTVSLFISNLTNSSYQEYSLKAANDVSKAHYEIILSEESTALPSTAEPEVLELVTVLVQDEGEAVLGDNSQSQNVYGCLLHILLITFIINILKIGITT